MSKGIYLCNDVLESIFAHLTLSELNNICHICHDWSLVVLKSMIPTGATIIFKRHASRSVCNSRLMRHVSTIKIACVIPSSLYKRLSGLYKIIKRGKYLTTVDLSYSPIGDKGIFFLGDAIKHSSITALIFRDDKIGDSGASSIAEAIKCSYSLVMIDLSSNSIGDKGISFIADAIKQNKSLTSMDLSHNLIGDKGASYIQEAIGQSSLTELCLRYNLIEYIHLSAIEDAIKLKK